MMRGPSSAVSGFPNTAYMDLNLFRQYNRNVCQWSKVLNLTIRIFVRLGEH